MSALDTSEKLALRRQEGLKASTWDWSLVGIARTMRNTRGRRRRARVAFAVAIVCIAAAAVAGVVLINGRP